MRAGQREETCRTRRYSQRLRLSCILLTQAARQPQPWLIFNVRPMNLRMRITVSLLVFGVVALLSPLTTPLLYSIVCGSVEIHVTRLHEPLLAVLVPGALLSSVSAALVWSLTAPRVQWTTRLLELGSVLICLVIALMASRVAFRHQNDALALVGTHSQVSMHMPFNTVLFYVGYPGVVALAAVLLVRQRGGDRNATSNLGKYQV